MSLASVFSDPVSLDVLNQSLIMYSDPVVGTGILPDNPFEGLLDFIQTPPEVNYDKTVTPFVEGSLTTPTESSNGQYRESMEVAIYLNERLQDAGIAFLSVYLAYFILAWGAGVKQGSQAVREGAKIIGAVVVVLLSPTIMWELLAASSSLAPAISEGLQGAYSGAVADAYDGFSVKALIGQGQGLITSIFMIFGGMCLFLLLVLVDYLRMAVILAGFSFMPLFIAASLFAGTVPSIGQAGKKGIGYTVSAIFLPISITIALNFSIITYQLLPTASPLGVIDGFLLILVMFFGVWAGLKTATVGAKIAGPVEKVAMTAAAVAGGAAVGAAAGGAAQGASKALKTGGKVAVTQAGGRGGQVAARELGRQAPDAAQDQPSAYEDGPTGGSGEKSAATESRTGSGGGGGGGGSNYTGGTRSGSTTAAQSTASTVRSTLNQAVSDTGGDVGMKAAATDGATASEYGLAPNPEDRDVGRNPEVMEAWSRVDSDLSDDELAERTLQAGTISGKHLEYDQLASEQQEALAAAGMGRNEYYERRLMNNDAETTYGTDPEAVKTDMKKAYGSVESAPAEAQDTLTRVQATDRAEYVFDNDYDPNTSSYNSESEKIFDYATGIDPGSNAGQVQEQTINDYVEQYDRVMGLGHMTDPNAPDADILDPADHPEAARAYHDALRQSEGHQQTDLQGSNGIEWEDSQGNTQQWGTTKDFEKINTDAHMAVDGSNNSSNLQAHTAMLDGTGQALDADEIQDLYADPQTTHVSPARNDSLSEPSKVSGDLSLVSTETELRGAHSIVAESSNPQYADNVSDEAKGTIADAKSDEWYNGSSQRSAAKDGTAVREQISENQGETSTLDDPDHDESSSGGFM